MSDAPFRLTPPPDGYTVWLTDLKDRIHSARQRASLVVNRDLVLLYWQIGRDILARQTEQGWGATKSALSPCERLNAMKQTSITETPCSSDLDEAPNMSGADFDHANFRVAGVPASRAQWAEAVRSHLDNKTLRRAMEARGLEANLRQIIREELGAVHS